MFSRTALRVVLGLSVLFCLVSLVGADPAKEPGRPLFSFDVRHDVSLPWRNIPQKPVLEGEKRVSSPRLPARLVGRAKPADAGRDPVVQDTLPILTPAPSLTFEGLSDDDNAIVAGGRIVPPDTNGDVGPTRYVQFINLILAVYDKATGARTFGPVAGNSIWNGFGGICELNNDGDTIVLYDHISDRWVLSQFALGNDGHQCIAVSTTGDPAGSYYRYDFNVSPGAMNDYPKFGVWGDGYYMTANEFTNSFAGAIAVAFDRSKMINGQPAQMVKFGPLGCGTECFYSVQPSHLNGAAPAAGTPNTFIMAFDDETWGSGANPDGYRLWNFHVDWTTPANSTFTALGQVNAPEFDANMCQFNSACIPQARPGEKLDSLSQFTMYRAQFRHFTTYDSLVVSHTVDSTGRNLAGVRWSELRRSSGGNWTLYQTGTIAPGDGLHRWMSSIAMDANGNIAVGYSASSRKAKPSIRYATRGPADPLGTMSAETEMYAGAGVQQSSYNRWGDYSTMSVDPASACTFWYTNEYYANNGSFDFKTRIGSFTIPGCSP